MCCVSTLLFDFDFSFLFFFFSSRRRHTRCALVTGVQTCALPIYYRERAVPRETAERPVRFPDLPSKPDLMIWSAAPGEETPGRDGARERKAGHEIGRASCRERVCQYV